MQWYTVLKKLKEVGVERLGPYPFRQGVPCQISEVEHWLSYEGDAVLTLSSYECD